ncbi:MAG TPA: phosphatidylglycerol lysyltransferase domain-containing protein [Candidatus Saccharimonadales bacterium]|nr:phosphatidylglycerol lysyltransferase domain-containing protein [Candidatus Saccharimonadales bacterium]
MKFLSSQIRRRFVLQLVAFGVFMNGLILVGTTLLEQVFNRSNPARISSAVSSLPLLLGLTLIYLATLLKRRKYAAWLVALPVYGLLLGLELSRTVVSLDHHHLTMPGFVRAVAIPIVVVSGLLGYRKEFNVKSDIRNFTLAARTSALVLIIALAYGVAGFMVMDIHDFHQEISLGEAFHRTIDQLDITTRNQLVPYTARSKLFLDSLSILSSGAVAYAFISLFQPLRARLTDQTKNRQLMEELLETHNASSEDYFKLWPHDKIYFFNWKHTAGLAYHVSRGVALVVGDPAGKHADFDNLMEEFGELCRVNDWLPAFIHTEPKFKHLYQKHGLDSQKIGEEAIVHLDDFQKKVADQKYFRQIRNKFTKQRIAAEMLTPPHSPAVLERLRVVSDEWLRLPGRSERGFMMGYFSKTYVQQCPVMVLRDDAGTIQAFINQIPSFDKPEANYDMLRYTEQAPTNSNDFLLMSFIDYLISHGFERLNLGLCPLAGLGEDENERTVIDSALQFVYSNGDRFYSFSGLQRFKSKYEPLWEDRYIAYKGGLRGFTRSLTALNRTMDKTTHTDR